MKNTKTLPYMTCCDTPCETRSVDGSYVFCANCGVKYGPTFTTPDVLPSGQTGWTIDLRDRINMRKHYRTCRVLGFTRAGAARSTAMWLQTHRFYGWETV